MLDRENHAVIDKYNILREKVRVHEAKLDEIAHRDNHVYRSLFGVDTLPLWHGEGEVVINKAQREALPNEPYAAIMDRTWINLDRLAMNIYRLSTSLDELQVLAKNKEALSTAIPALWPIDKTLLRYGIGAYGMRFHPIYKRNIMHHGIDLACPTGSPIYATGDGIVEKSVQGYKYRGYGQEVLIDHQFGYKTRYGHMSKRLVEKGDKVKRGDIIGLIGSTGGSTGPHLHYEVIINGKSVNPINYFNRNMSNEEYIQIMEQMQDTEYEIVDQAINEDNEN
ncbi:MAG: M23 family metallopeptidase [Rikenellaceae bacterium]